MKSATSSKGVDILDSLTRCWPASRARSTGPRPSHQTSLASILERGIPTIERWSDLRRLRGAERSAGKTGRSGDHASAVRVEVAAERLQGGKAWVGAQGAQIAEQDQLVAGAGQRHVEAAVVKHKWMELEAEAAERVDDQDTLAALEAVDGVDQLVGQGD